ncbi:hypothetical protein BDP27DRAFT_1437965, partial [Rhodocollybia butyracea]
KLKENIWKGLNIDELTPKKNAEDMDVDDDDDVPEPVKAHRGSPVHLCHLQPPKILSSGQDGGKLAPAFAFICLLHLANEQGLKLENNATSLLGGNSVDIKIGNIWDLKVYCDPKVSQTA